MQVEGFFESLGQMFGAIIRFIVEGLSGIFSGLSNAGGNFIEGLSQTLGMQASIISIALLVLGLLCLYNAVRAFMRTSIIGGVVWLLLGLWVISGLIN